MTAVENSSSEVRFSLQRSELVALLSFVCMVAPVTFACGVLWNRVAALEREVSSVEARIDGRLESIESLLFRIEEAAP